MPRRRPSDVRGGHPARSNRHFVPYPYPPINGLSGGCVADIRRQEYARFWPGATAKAFWHWSTLAHGPLKRIADPFTSTRCGDPGCGCDPGYSRDHLEAIVHALPKKSARELRKAVRDLDRKILSRARVLRADSMDVPWWQDQL